MNILHQGIIVHLLTFIFFLIDTQINNNSSSSSSFSDSAGMDFSNFALQRQQDNDLACGSDHTAVVTSEGKVVCWGGPNQCGETTVPRLLENVVAVSCGSEHTAALTRDGKVVCWGDNRCEQCSVPVELESEIVTAISCGYNHSAALTKKGKIVCWGDSDLDIHIVPSDPEVYIAISCGAYKNSAIKNEGAVGVFCVLVKKNFKKKKKIVYIHTSSAF
jgi:alpha-tubulin suppressor-like RCC1 family protein